MDVTRKEIALGQVILTENQSMCSYNYSTYNPLPSVQSTNFVARASSPELIIIDDEEAVEVDSEDSDVIDGEQYTKLNCDGGQ